MTKGLQRTRVLILLVSIVLLSVGCASVPGANVSEEDINAQALVAYNEVKAKSKRSTNVEWNEAVQRIAQRIAEASGETTFKWEAILIENPEPNAWCMPGGKMAVNTGIIPVLKTEAALAAVLGHEVAHATRRHGKQRYARAIQQGYLGAVVGVATAVAGQLYCESSQCKQLTALGGVAAAFAMTFFDRKFSRGDETDADRYGQIYMAKAGYEPSESIKLWERMGAANKGKAPPEFLSTHPSDQRRRANLTSWLPEAQRIYEQSPEQFGLGKSL